MHFTSTESNSSLDAGRAPLPDRNPVQRSSRWRVVDIVTASVLGVAAGVIFWAWGLAWGPLSTALAFTPGLGGLLAGGWLFAGVLGGLVIRKPGAAIYTEVVAAAVSALIGTVWGFETLIWGLIQGVGAEIIFALFFYRSFRLWVALLAGAGAGVAVGFLDTTFTSYAALDAGAKLTYFVSAVVSGTVLAGLLSWFAVRGLAATGALSRFASGNQTRARARRAG
ncbi:energy-coupling factor transport system substrate-specific component [Okibacterium sp. HSC-33S16]|uniref:ECF transporter S component n=1 Tax=Okibacterium sp. HSC-33S16 TaxID=2910965 RepID=UPI00209F2551|nr:ECF transporter S component [Okibacterium sp. HSC-33S16]MCP2030603.1 energy-coupling factor transport system substrate-specific component [Okibacterium sp. HSC-33S16]